MDMSTTESAGNSISDVPTSPEGDAKHSPPRAWASAEDWATLKPKIITHYRDDNMKLKELIVFMEETYNFRATAKMYKDRLAKWRVSKNVRARDIQILAAATDAAPTGASEDFYVVDDRLLRADRVQQAWQRRANMARRRSVKKQRVRTVSPSPTPSLWAPAVHRSSSRPLLSPAGTEGLRVCNGAETEALQQHTSQVAARSSRSALALQPLKDSDEAECCLLQQCAPSCSSRSHSPRLPQTTTPPVSSTVVPRHILPQSSRVDPSWPGLPSSPFSRALSLPSSLQPLASLLHHSRSCIAGMLDTPTPPVIHLNGPVQRCFTAFEDTLANLVLVHGLSPAIVFQSFDRAFELLRPALLAHDPALLPALMQTVALFLWFRRPEIRAAFVRYVCELSSLLLGARHPISLVCAALRGEGSDEACAALCRLASEAAWAELHHRRRRRRRRSGGRDGDDDDDDDDEEGLVKVAGMHADVLDSLGLVSEAEGFLRRAVEGDGEEAVNGAGRALHLELHLVLCLRRQGKFSEALARIGRIREEALRRRGVAELARMGEEKALEEMYQTLRISAMCECDGGDVDKGRALFWEAFELMQEKKGRYSPRTTRALRDVIRYSELDVELVKDLEDRVAKSSLDIEKAI